MVVLVVHGGAGGDGGWKGLSSVDPDRVSCLKALLSDVGSKLKGMESLMESRLHLVIHSYIRIFYDIFIRH
jgi:hypothetical protein